MMARKAKSKPEPLQPGDEEIAREEIEAYYAWQIEQARAELAAAQERFDRERELAEASITAFRAGERVPKLDAWQIEVHAGGRDRIFRDAEASGTAADWEAYDRAKARNEATNRWLRHNGYESVEEAR
jgi:hypothetical protein